MVVPQSKSFRSGKMLGALDRDSLQEPSSSRIGNASANISGNISGNLDESTALSSLKELIAAGNHRLDPMLATITDAARQLTSASGAALAMWKDGAMVCRARSGHTAPAIGARLSAQTGISGECLRTGKIQHCTDTENDPLVDVEVCRSLALRSIAVLPIQGWRGVNGVLEVFSTKAAAFTEQDISFLQQLAALAERARASQPHDASSAARKLPSAIERPQPSGLLPASDRVGDVALAFLGNRSRPFLLSAIGLAAISLLALVIWLGWRGPDDADGDVHATTSSSIGATAINPETITAVTAHRPDKHPLDNDPVWKANPGGEPLFSSHGKTSAGTPVRFASKVEVLPGKQTHGDRSFLLGDVAANVAVPHDVTSSQAGSQIGSQTISHDDPSSDPRSDESASTEPPANSADSKNQSALNGVLSAKASVPGLSAPVSQGVTGGELVHRVAPIYPAQARRLRLEGTVILAAMVMEDGTVGDVNVVEGSPELAQSAVDAVKHWRYRPYELDGKPVKNETRITVNFKFPNQH